MAAKRKTSRKKAVDAESSSGEPQLAISWVLEYRFAEEGWFADRASTDLIVDAIAATAWWDELDVAGADAMPGTPLESVDDLKERVASLGRGIHMLAAGGPRAAVFTDETTCWLKIDVMPGYFSLAAGAAGEVLTHMGPAALTDLIELALALRTGWGDGVHLQDGCARPIGAFADRYPNPRPRRSAVRHRPLAAVVDIVDPTFEPFDEQDNHIGEARALAAASLPPDVTRTEHDGVIVMRWIDDPSDGEETMEAARRHEAWIADVIETTVAEGWNQLGDRRVQVPIRPEPKPPFDIWDEDRRIGYVIDEDDDAAAVQKAAELIGDQMEVVVVVADRARALTLEEAAKDAGIARVLYAEEGRYWDPRPNGPWWSPRESAKPQR